MNPTSPTHKLPNPEIPASDLWLALTSIPRAHRIVDYPRTNPETGEAIGQIWMQPITQEEQYTVTKRAWEFAKKHMGDAPRDGEFAQAWKDVYNNACAIEILCVACRSVKDPKHPAFPRPADVMRVMSNDEIAVLFNQYLGVQADFGPIISRMEEPEREAWIKRLQEGGDAFPLAALTSDSRDDLLIWSVKEVVALRKRVETLRTVLSSAGLQHEDPSLPPVESPTTFDEFANEETPVPVDEFSDG